MGELLEMTVDSIRVHIPSGQHVVILKESAAERYLPIWIGVSEANAIALRVAGITPERPITHDLFANFLSEAGCVVDKVVVTSLANEVYYAHIDVQVAGKTIELDSRPSDAIAIAVRVGATILVSSDVLEAAGGELEPGMEGGAAGEPDEQRFDKIKNWINELDLPDLGTGPTGPDAS